MPTLPSVDFNDLVQSLLLTIAQTQHKQNVKSNVNFDVYFFAESIFDANKENPATALVRVIVESNRQQHYKDTDISDDFLQISLPQTPLTDHQWQQFRYCFSNFKHVYEQLGEAMLAGQYFEDFKDVVIWTEQHINQQILLPQFKRAVDILNRCLKVSEQNASQSNSRSNSRSNQSNNQRINQSQNDKVDKVDKVDNDASSRYFSISQSTKQIMTRFGPILTTYWSIGIPQLDKEAVVIKNAQIIEEEYQKQCLR